MTETILDKQKCVFSKKDGSRHKKNIVCVKQ